MELGRLVAAMTTTLDLALRPSMRVRSCETTLRSTSPLVLSLFGAIESISSMKMMAGAFFSASSKAFLRLDSDSWEFEGEIGRGSVGNDGQFERAWETATYAEKTPLLTPAILLMISGPLIKKKKAPVSLATALAISVLPVPGGPNMRTPRGGLIPMDLKSWG